MLKGRAEVRLTAASKSWFGAVQGTPSLRWSATERRPIRPARLAAPWAAATPPLEAERRAPPRWSLALAMGRYGAD